MPSPNSKKLRRRKAPARPARQPWVHMDALSVYAALARAATEAAAEPDSAPSSSPAAPAARRRYRGGSPVMTRYHFERVDVAKTIRSALSPAGWPDNAASVGKC